MTEWNPIDSAIAAATATHFRSERRHAVGGGCINQAWVIEGAGRRYFVKLNEPATAAMFVSEADGLNAILASGAIRAPVPICWGSSATHAYLVLEYLPLTPPDRHGMARLGAALAMLHRHCGKQFGWHRDNTIGSTPQLNAPSDDWTAFWRERRLRYQLERAARRGGAALQRKGERLLAKVGDVLRGHAPAPSLLHGDLWSGNCAALAGGEPVVFDPAVYYGDRETDLAMTELFGGYSPAFYSAYQEHYPLADGYAQRKILYNLYHVLNHYNLFGGGYAAQAERMMDQLSSEIR